MCPNDQITEVSVEKSPSLSIEPRQLVSPILHHREDSTNTEENKEQPKNRHRELIHSSS